MDKQLYQRTKQLLNLNFNNFKLINVKSIVSAANALRCGLIAILGSEKLSPKVSFTANQTRVIVNNLSIEVVLFSPY